ncbi:MAG: CocE/NonD family hydrolase C-terminal non-catalytic domain-containing protein [Aquabacterium sp.]
MAWPSSSRYTYFMLGEDTWLSADSWPPADAAKVRWYLASEGHANSRKGDGRLDLQAPAEAKTDVFRYDPTDPVPSRGGPLCCTATRMKSQARPSKAMSKSVATCSSTHRCRWPMTCAWPAL